MFSRRFILTTGTAAALIGGGGLTGWAAAPGALAKAREPWRQAGESFGDPRLDALAYAILAPNPHNRQPWVFDLNGDNRVDITCDLKRRLPATDPFDRQITIGFGAMLELMRMAAAEKGWRTDIIPFPDGEAQPRLDARRIASVQFSPATPQQDSLFSTIITRRTTRAAFATDRPVADETIEGIVTAAQPNLQTGFATDPTMRAKFIDIARRAWIIEYEGEETRRESINLMRIGNRAIAKNPDGIALDGAAMGIMNMTGVISAEKLDTPGALAYKTGLSSYAEAIETSQGFVWLTSDENSRASQLNAGRDWVRIHLAAQEHGIAAHPLSQALQEFPAMAGLYDDLKETLGVTAPGVVQMFARLGYTKFPAPSPRWPLESCLRANTP